MAWFHYLGSLEGTIDGLEHLGTILVDDVKRVDSAVHADLLRASAVFEELVPVAQIAAPILSAADPELAPAVAAALIGIEGAAGVTAALNKDASTVDAAAGEAQTAVQNAAATVTAAAQAAEAAATATKSKK